jgi:hypothetical protein
MGTYRQPATIRDQAGLKQAADTFSTDNLVDEDLIMAATGEGECSPCKDGSVPGKDKDGKCIPCSQNNNSNQRMNKLTTKTLGNLNPPGKKTNPKGPSMIQYYQNQPNKPQHPFKKN